MARHVVALDGIETLGRAADDCVALERQSISDAAGSRIGEMVLALGDLRMHGQQNASIQLENGLQHSNGDASHFDVISVVPGIVPRGKSIWSTMGSAGSSRTFSGAGIGYAQKTLRNGPCQVFYGGRYPLSCCCCRCLLHHSEPKTRSTSAVYWHPRLSNSRSQVASDKLAVLFVLLTGLKARTFLSVKMRIHTGKL